MRLDSDGLKITPAGQARRSRCLRRRERARDELLSYSRRRRREQLNGAETASRLRSACPLGWAK